MTEDEQREETTPEGDDVEGHGARQIAAAGLAGAALIGAGAVGVKVATDDDRSRNKGALVSEIGSLERADPDQDGFATYHDLAREGFKIDTELLKVEGLEVTADALAAAGHKIELALVGKDEGFPLESDTILLKQEVDERLDELAKTSALEWADKFKELDRDGDGYAGGAELAELGWKLASKDLEGVSWKYIEVKSLEEAGVKVDLATLGEGGYSIEDGTIFHKDGVDERLDAFIKGEKG